MNNCHGCKWLDRYRIDGNGYCCKVERSKTQSKKVRRPHMERCELYSDGDFATRYKEVLKKWLSEYASVIPKNRFCRWNGITSASMVKGEKNDTFYR